MATVITPTEVIAEFGSYYIDQGQNMSNLLQRPYQAFGTREAFTNVPTEDTQLRYSDVQVGEILQPYQDTFTAKGSVVFKPVKIDLVQVKIDQAFNPNNLTNSWLGFLSSNNTDRTTWPYTRWFIEVYLMKAAFDDMEKKVIFKGERVEPGVGVAGAAIEAMDGVKKLLKSGVTAGSITPIALGALPNDPVDLVTYVEEFCENIPEDYQDEAIELNLSQANWRKYRKGRKKKYNQNYAQVSDMDLVEEFDNISVKGRRSMQGSGNLWGTMKNNAVFATKGFSNAQAFELEKTKREVVVYSDFWIGAGFLLKDLVFTNGEGL
ncbi:MAG: hypothetical protein IAE96_04800 [Chitinophagaceae bacterium]|nr:hypothetical protein [Chitinophagaceae bacterium]